MPSCISPSSRKLISYYIRDFRQTVKINCWQNIKIIVTLIQIIQKIQVIQIMKIYLKGKSNIFEEIIDQYKQYILLGLLQDGDRLPSCRNLAKDLGINPNTVSRAYTELEKQGFITNIPKKGVYVSFNVSKENRNEIREAIINLFNKGISKNDLLNVIDEIYGGDNDD